MIPPAILNSGKIAILLALLSAAGFAADVDEFERILLPVANLPTPGGYGSEWISHFTLFNGNAVPLVTAPNSVGFEDLFPVEDDCLFPPPSCSGPVVEPHTSFRPKLYHPKLGAAPGVLLYVRRTLADKVMFSLRAQDVSRQHLTWGSEIPVVREKELRSDSIDLIEIPTDPRFRVALRVYDPYQLPMELDGPRTEVRIEIFAMDREVPLRQIVATLTPQRPAKPCPKASTAGIPCVPASFQVLNLVDFAGDPGPAALLRVRITPMTPGLRFWAFATVTNNETQHLTLITPQ